MGESISISKPKEIIKEVVAAARKWPAFAREAGVKEKEIQEKAGFHSLDLI